MTLRVLAGLILVLMVLAVPWMFKPTTPAHLMLGMPGWALYSLLVTLVFAIVVAWIIATKWQVLERGEERE